LHSPIEEKVVESKVTGRDLLEKGVVCKIDRLRSGPKLMIKTSGLRTVVSEAKNSAQSNVPSNFLKSV